MKLSFNSQSADEKLQTESISLVTSRNWSVFAWLEKQKFTSIETFNQENSHWKDEKKSFQGSVSELFQVLSPILLLWKRITIA